MAILRILSVAIAVLLFPMTALPVSPVQLTYWCATNPEEVKLANQLIDDWNKGHPDIRVKVQPIPAGNSSEEVLFAAVVAKTTPDIYSNLLPAIMSQLVKAKAVVALDEFPDFRPTMLARMDEKILNMYRSLDGHIYQAPWKSNPVMLAYNADLFKEMKLTPPGTYAEFMEVARKVTRDLNGDGRYETWAMSPSTLTTWWQRLFDFLPFYTAATSGRTLFANGKIDFNRPEAIGVFKFFAEGFKKNYFPNTGMIGDLFLEQKTAMSVVGPWAVKYFERAMVKKFNFDFSPIPVPDSRISPVFTYGDPKNISIFTTTKHPKEAWEVVKHLISKRADRDLLLLTNQIPIRKNLITDPEFKEIFKDMPKIAKFAQQAAYIAPMDDSPHIKQIFDYLGQQYEAAAVYGVITSEKAIPAAAQRAKEIIEYW